MSTTSPPLVALDWGTSALRGALLSAHGEVLQRRAFDVGIRGVPPGSHHALVQRHFGDWLQTPDARCLICGMAGSREGWVEAPYRACPTRLDALAEHITWIEPDRIGIVPGLSCERDGVPDVMRGEETQLLGALQLLGADTAWLVLPGTHSKWVEVCSGVVSTFATWMTGECYAVLREHTILARSLVAAPDVFDGASFDAGVVHALRSGSLLQSAFGVRAMALFGRVPLERRLSLLSGVVIGEEMRSRPSVQDSEVVIVGSDELGTRYQRALALCGVRSRCVGEDAAWRGLGAVAQAVWS
jgi:2-dehydro-3-deoxygalactonokinase